MAAQVRLQFAHRNKLFRECLLTALVGRDFEAREIDHEKHCLHGRVPDWRPDVVLIDLGLPEGFAVEMTRYFCGVMPKVKIILLIPSPHPSQHEKEMLLECIEMGVHGYVLDHTSLDDLTTAVKRGLTGDTFCSPEILEAVFTDWAFMARETGFKRSVVESSQLSRRELEVLSCVAEGLSNKQVARRLSVSLYTVKNHVHRILKKLDVGDRFAAARYAVERQWITPANHLIVAEIASRN